MRERNICNETGCRALCCFGPKFPPLKITKEQILTWFPEAVQTNSIELSISANKRGVYFQPTGDKFIIKIIGYCPNLDENSGCKIYNNKPGPCEAFLFGGKGCSDVRISNFLPPVNEESI